MKLLGSPRGFQMMFDVVRERSPIVFSFCFFLCGTIKFDIALPVSLGTIFSQKKLLRFQRDAKSSFMGLAAGLDTPIDIFRR